MKQVTKLNSIINSFYNFLYRRKYEILLFGLLQHLFLPLFVSQIEFYIQHLWPISMIVLGISSFGIYEDRNILHLKFLRILVLVICILPFTTKLTGFSKANLIFISISYGLYFIFVFLKVLQFLFKPSYINVDIISSSVCGFLLLIEAATFIQQTVFYINPASFLGINISTPANTFVDFVYLSTITTTSIGFGDILPNTHSAKLLVSLIGIIGQLYSVVLVGILISKFSSRNTTSNLKN